MLEVNLDAATLDDMDAILRLRRHVATWLADRNIDLWQSPLPPERLVRWIETDEVLVQRDLSRRLPGAGTRRSNTMPSARPRK